MKLLFYVLLYIVPACVFIYMAGMVYSRNRHSAKHITCSLVYVFTSMWFFGVFTSLIMYPRYFNEISLYWVNGAIAIAGLLSLHLWLMSANMYTEKRGKYLKCLFVPGIVVLLTVPFKSWMLKGDMNSTLEPMFNPGPGLYLLWFVDFSYLLIVIILTIVEMKKGNRAAKIWFSGIFLYFVWTVTMLTAAILLQGTNLYIFYFLLPHGSLFWAISIFLSMSKYDYLSSYEKRYNILFERSPVGILIMDEELTVLEASPQVSEYLGVTKKELISSSLLLFMRGINKREFMKKHQEMFEQQKKLENVEMSFVNRAGEQMTLLVDSDFIMVEGKSLQFVIVKDITDAKMKEEKVQYLAYHDILTGLFNRAAFEKQIENLLNKKERFYLLLLDLNKLKQINDTFGHQAGDQAIQHIAAILKKIAGHHDVARLGGDEFVLLFDVENPEMMIEHIQQELTLPVRLAPQHKIYLSASIGVSSYPDDGDTIDQLYKEADKRMYAEKKARREA